MNATQDAKADKSPEEWIRWFALIPVLILGRLLVGFLYVSLLAEGSVTMKGEHGVYSLEAAAVAVIGGIFLIWASRRVVPHRKMIVTFVALAFVLIIEIRSIMFKEAMYFYFCELCVIAGTIVGALIAVFKRPDPFDFRTAESLATRPLPHQDFDPSNETEGARRRRLIAEMDKGEGGAGQPPTRSESK